MNDTSLSWLIGGPLVYLSVAIFVFFTIYKIVGFIRLPRPFRWDLYPLPHRGPAGSKYQKVDFSLQKAQFFHFLELREMVCEILFIRKLFKNSFQLWLGSYALHAGLYLGPSAWIFLLAVPVGIPGGIAAAHSAVMSGLYALTTVVGAVALISGLAGSVFLLLRRTFSSDARAMSDMVSYINIGLMIVLFGVGLAAWTTVDGSFALLRSQVAGILKLKPVVPGHPLIAAELFFFALFLMYLPFSRMFHFVAKYFFYHQLMWDDQAMAPGSKMEQNRLIDLASRPQWAAPHFKAGGSWLDQVATEEKPQDKKST